MVVAFFKKRITAINVSIFAGVFILALQSCSSIWQRNEPHLQASGAPIALQMSKGAEFSQYLAQEKQLLKTLESQQVISADRALAATSKEYPPAEHCHTAPSRGVLLLHGLSDTPYGLTTLGQALAEQCFLARVIRLPGHGTTAADLQQTTRHDWRVAVEFALETLKRDSEQVYVAGMSLGGLLALDAAIRDPEIAGVIALSPAWALDSSFMLAQATWLRHLWPWVDTDVSVDPARYEALPTQAAAEVYWLMRDVQRQLAQQKALSLPVFLALSWNDGVIAPTSILDLFRQHILHPRSRAWVYKMHPTRVHDEHDSRITFKQSHIPKEKIWNFSHMALHIGPEHPHYGRHGRIRLCGEDAGRDSNEATLCQNSPEPWRGEIYSSEGFDHTNEGFARLTFHPRFNEMVAQIANFAH